MEKYMICLVFLLGCMSTTQQRQAYAPVGADGAMVKVGTEDTSGLTTASGVADLRDADTRALYAYGQVGMMQSYGKMYGDYARQVSSMSGQDAGLTAKVAGMEKDLDVIATELAGDTSAPAPKQGEQSTATVPAAPAMTTNATTSLQLGLSSARMEYVRAEIGRLTTVSELRSFLDRLATLATSEEDKRFVALVKGTADSLVKLPAAQQAVRVKEISKSLLSAFGTTASSAVSAPTSAQAIGTASISAAERFDRELNAAKSFSELAAAFENAERNALEADRSKFAVVVGMLKRYAALPSDERSALFDEVKQRFIGARETYRSSIK